MMIMTMAMMAEVEGEALVKLIWTDELLQAGGTLRSDVGYRFGATNDGQFSAPKSRHV
jgi:hypothetical protein